MSRPVFPCRSGGRLACAACLLAAVACTTDPGPALRDAVPDLDRRAGLEPGSLSAIGEHPWDRPDDRWAWLNLEDFVVSLIVIAVLETLD